MIPIVKITYILFIYTTNKLTDFKTLILVISIDVTLNYYDSTHIFHFYSNQIWFKNVFCIDGTTQNLSDTPKIFLWRYLLKMGTS